MKRICCLLTILLAACLAFGDSAITVPINQPNGSPAINPALRLSLGNRHQNQGFLSLRAVCHHPDPSSR